MIRLVSSLAMGRPLRASLGGYVYHVLNRGNGRRTVFFKDGDYLAFERVIAEALEHVPRMRLLAYVLMPNHWHLVLRPRQDGELTASRFRRTATSSSPAGTSSATRCGRTSWRTICVLRPLCLSCIWIASPARSPA